ncbi:MAG: histidinol-phosphate transaminase [Gammaproteobacteria bacterium]|nr:histidinol-phosphate transaminase [Gammaproteobacteria bacterium]
MKKIALSNPHIETLEPYQSARRIGGRGAVWINANELPFPRGPMKLDASQYHRYPDEGPVQVESAYAAYAGVPPEQVLALRGADEAIDLVTRAYCRAGRDKVLVSSPTYGMYRVSADIQNAAVVDVPLTADFQLDVEAICARDDVKLVFICNPNNPTGNAFRREDIIAILRHFEGRALVLIDEAYIEFCPRHSLVEELPDFEHLVVARTMSKAFGLAGVHVGFLLASDAVMAIMRKVVPPYPLADPCAQIALMALSAAGIETMRGQLEEIARVRGAFCQTLAEISAVRGYLPSEVNFVLADFAAPENAWRALTDAGIVARRLPGRRLADAIRFTIGSEEEMAAVAAVLRQL